MSSPVNIFILLFLLSDGQGGQPLQFSLGAIIVHCKVRGGVLIKTMLVVVRAGGSGFSFKLEPRSTGYFRKSSKDLGPIS